MNVSIASVLGLWVLATTASAQTQTQAPTWHQDIVPIVERSCRRCHAGGGVGPFELTNYGDAVENHKLMAEAVSTRYMPPWLPADDCSSYVDSRRLTAAEIDTIVRWSKAGAPEGNPSRAPPPPKAERPEVLLAPNARYTPSSAIGVSEVRCFSLGPPTGKQEAVSSVGIEPLAREDVRQATLYALPDASVRAWDRADTKLGWDCTGANAPTGGLIVGLYVPGVDAVMYPKGTAVTVPERHRYVLQVEYRRKSDPARPDFSVVKLRRLDDDDTYRAAALVPIRKTKFAIPPKAVGFTLSVTQRSTVSGLIAGVLPRMFSAGRRIKILKGTQCLVDIPLWEYDLHQFYFFDRKAEVSAEGADDTITVTCTWNNVSDAKIRSEDQNGDEACAAYLYMVESAVAAPTE